MQPQFARQGRCRHHRESQEGGATNCGAETQPPAGEGAWVGRGGSTHWADLYGNCFLQQPQAAGLHGKFSSQR